MIRTSATSPSVTFLWTTGEVPKTNSTWFPVSRRNASPISINAGRRGHVPIHEDACVEEFWCCKVRADAAQQVLHPLSSADEGAAVRDHAELFRENAVETVNVPPRGSV